MISILILIIFTGCFFIYNTSKKALLKENNFIDNWLQTNKKRAKKSAVLILLLTLIIASFLFGAISGILFWLFTVTLLLSLIILLFPLNIVKKKPLLVLFITILLFEIILKN